MSTQIVEFPSHERPRTEVNIVQMVGIATACTIIWFMQLWFTPITKANFVRDLFLGSESKNGVLVHPYLIERVIFQGLITWVFALSMGNILLKFQGMKRERAAIADAGLPEDLDMSDSERLIEVYNRVKERPNVVESLGLTRAARVLAMWINTGDFERTTEYAREQAVMDAAASDSSFRRNRLFIWAMPLLGFVGTVYGVAAGISGFAAFLKAANVTPEQIKEQVGLITSGLAVAFYCTLLGLLTAGLAAFPSLMAERREEDVL